MSLGGKETILFTRKAKFEIRHQRQESSNPERAGKVAEF